MTQTVKVPRFKWNDKKVGRVINQYVDMLADEFPTIAKDIAKKGIKGDLGSWFAGDNTDDWWDGGPENATCGCLVGTTCLVAMKRSPAASNKAGVNEESDGAVALYRLLVAKTKRDVGKWYPDGLDSLSSSNAESYPEHHDPLFVLIAKAGYGASYEAEAGDEWEAFKNQYDDDTDYDELAYKIRQQQVVDHIENRIRRKLNIPYPKRGKRVSAKASR